MTLEDIKNDVAKIRGYKSWEHLSWGYKEDSQYDEAWTEVCIRAQRQFGVNAAENAVMCSDDIPNVVYTRYYCREEELVITVHKPSITNENNLVR
jgi:hypothetical protein